MLSQYVAVRSLHVLSAGLLLGGAAGIWLAFRVAPAVSVRFLWWFEAVFWGAVGVLFFTGFGNVAGYGVPAVGTTRGTVLLGKFSAILVVVGGSLIRTFAVVELDSRGDSETASHRLRLLYGATAWLIAVIVVAAGVVAHG